MGNGLAWCVVGNYDSDCRDSQELNYQVGNEVGLGNAVADGGEGNEEGDCPCPVGNACEQDFFVGCNWHWHFVSLKVRTA